MSQIYSEMCNLCFIPFIALKRNILENLDFVLLKEDIHRFISSTELFLRVFRGLRYADLKRLTFLWDTRAQQGSELNPKCEV